MTESRTQSKTTIGEIFYYGGRAIEGFIAAATYQDMIIVDGYQVMADFIVVVDKIKFGCNEKPDKKRGQVKARGLEMRIMSILEDASSYTLTLKVNP